jgi:hypothetical protein
MRNVAGSSCRPDTFVYIEPEVAGGLGENTLLDVRTHPPVVTRLHYEFRSEFTMH